MHVPSTETQSRALLDRLRSETREEHQRLEDGLDLLRPSLSLEQYSEILQRFYGFYRPWESKVAKQASEILPDFAARQGKVNNLVADLNYLGIDCGTLPLCAELPRLDSVPAMLGGLYVTEGATLGGQLISRHVRRSFQFPDGQGDRFFCSYGDKVGSMWTAFREQLLQRSSPENDDEIVRGAREMFRSIHLWMIGTA